MLLVGVHDVCRGARLALPSVDVVGDGCEVGGRTRQHTHRDLCVEDVAECVPEGDGGQRVTTEIGEPRLRSHLVPGEIECGRDDVDQYVERRPTRCGCPSIAKSIGAGIREV